MKQYANKIAEILALAEQDGFQRGWQAARDALSNPTPQVKVAGSAISAAQQSKRKKKSKKQPKPAGAGSTVEKRVLACIESNPGKTGAQIIKLLDDVNPRTVRTMLRRLKMRGRIEKSGEGWFTKLE